MDIKKIFWLLLLVMMCFPMDVNALTGNIILNCDKTSLSSNEGATCTVKGRDFSGEISSFHAKLSLGDGLTLDNITVDSSWQGDASGGVIDLYTDKNKTGEVNFVTFVVKAGNINTDKTISLKVTDIKIGDANFRETGFNDSSFSIKLISDGNGSTEEPDDGVLGEEQPDADDNITENPKTGQLSIIVVVGIMIVFLMVMILYKRKSEGVK